MNEVCKKAEDFLTEIINDLQFDLEVSSEWTDEGCVLNLSGNDTDYVLSENGEMLDAFETLLFQLYGRQLDREHRFVCDAEKFRQTRKSELSAMAKFAAQKVREKKAPFTFGELNSTERRLIHLYLQNEEDVKTESVGEGKKRRLKVSLN